MEGREPPARLVAEHARSCQEGLEFARQFRLLAQQRLQQLGGRHLFSPRFIGRETGETVPLERPRPFEEQLRPKPAHALRIGTGFSPTSESPRFTISQIELRSPGGGGAGFIKQPPQGAVLGR
jgi:hypothetical protein